MMMSDVELVGVLEAVRRIPDGISRRRPFFTQGTLWFFLATAGACPTCQGYSGSIFAGDELRSEFPYLNVLDEDTIAPDIHPNCNCTLHRTDLT